MSRIFYAKSAPVKPTRRTSRGPTPFGAGILPMPDEEDRETFTPEEVREWENSEFLWRLREISEAEMRYIALEESREVERRADEERWRELERRGLGW